MQPAGEVRFLACAGQTRMLPPASGDVSPQPARTMVRHPGENLTEALINCSFAAVHICGRVCRLQITHVHSHPVGRFGFFSVVVFFLNTVSIIMLRAPSRGMIILSYYRRPDAAHTFPLPLLEGEKKKHSSCFSGTICKEKITDPR